MSQHALNAEVQRLREQLESGRGGHKPTEEGGAKRVPVNVADVKKQLRELEFRMTSGKKAGKTWLLADFCAADILSETRVVCATCIGAGHDLLAEHRFPLVLIDGMMKEI